MPQHQQLPSLIPLVRAQHLTVRRGDTSIFSALDITLYRHEHLAVTGSNGVGKSSLLEVLAGQLFPVKQTSSQLVWEFGTDYNTSALAARKYARLVSPAQQARYARQDWQVTGEDIICAGFSNEALVYSPLEEPQRQQLHTLVQLAAAEELLPMPLDAMSQGQLRFVLLLRALVACPKLLLLDEPFDGLSGTRRAALEFLLAHVAEQGVTVVLTAHRVQDIPAFIRYAVHLEPAGAPASFVLPAGFTDVPAGSAYLPSDFHSAEHAFHLSSRSSAPISREKSQQSRVEEYENVVTGMDFPDNAFSLFDMRSLCERCAAKKTSDSVSGSPGVVPVLCMNEVDVYIDRTHVLKNINWQVLPGEHWVVSGENGAGKSTLLRLLYGEEVAAYGGTVRWCGQERPPLPFWRYHVGLVSDRLQQQYDYDLSALEVVLSGRGGTIGLYDEPAAAEYVRARELLEFFRVGHVADVLYFSLSSGLGRRVLMARAMMCSPALLLLDEPCSGLDADSRALFFASLADLAASGIQLMYVSHHAADIPSFFTHELVLEKGTAVRCGMRHPAPL